MNYNLKIPLRLSKYATIIEEEKIDKIEEISEDSLMTVDAELIDTSLKDESKEIEYEDKFSNEDFNVKVYGWFKSIGIILGISLNLIEYKKMKYIISLLVVLAASTNLVGLYCIPIEKKDQDHLKEAEYLETEDIIGGVTTVIIKNIGEVIEDVNSNKSLLYHGNCSSNCVEEDMVIRVEKHTGFLRYLKSKKAFLSNLLAFTFYLVPETTGYLKIICSIKEIKDSLSSKINHLNFNMIGFLILLFILSTTLIFVKKFKSKIILVSIALGFICYSFNFCFDNEKIKIILLLIY
ncbi:hypothetical protein A0H76_922 [Hepatospora eriocheir]|uniref:Uncharacterized protein n=1 Tax=Hepatospora eriocheir TaxID=1081669 RepID=A0A1X0QI35_9MICR|nr:hypothetical protein A0H76_922 [Hepatospora eriocheir]